MVQVHFFFYLFLRQLFLCCLMPKVPNEMHAQTRPRHIAGFHSLLLSVKRRLWEGRGSMKMLEKQGKDTDGMGEGRKMKSSRVWRRQDEADKQEASAEQCHAKVNFAKAGGPNIHLKQNTGGESCRGRCCGSFVASNTELPLWFCLFVCMSTTSSLSPWNYVWSFAPEMKLSNNAQRDVDHGAMSLISSSQLLLSNVCRSTLHV